MTVTNTKRSITYTGNDATTIWSYDFRIPEVASANVKLVEIATGIETPLLTTEYEISGIDETAGGTVTYPLTGSPLTSLFKIVIFRDVSRTQPTTITNQSAFFASVVMRVWDRIVMMVQDVTNDINRGLRSPIGEDTLAELPSSAERAGTFLGFDGSGDPIAIEGVVGEVPVTPYMETLLDDADAATARATLGVGLGTGDLVAANNLSDVASGATAFTNIKQGATESITGVVEAATTAEMTAGTAGKYPDADKVKAYADAAPTPFSAALFHVRDIKAAGTNGGTFTSGAWQTRDLNTVDTNEISGASLAVNVLTLPAGVYYFKSRAPAYRVEFNVSRLYNNTDAAVIYEGDVADAISGDTGTTVFMSGRFTIAGTKAIELQHRCSATRAGDGFGVGADLGQTNSTFASIEFWKVG